MPNVTDQISRMSGNILFMNIRLEIVTDVKYSDSLRAYFEKYGEIRDVDIKIDPATQASRGFGFVLFAESSSIDSLEADTTQHHLGTSKTLHSLTPEHNNFNYSV